MGDFSGKFRIITWAPYKTAGFGGDVDTKKRIALQFESPFRFSAGLEPDINTAIVSSSELAKLDLKTDLQRHGKIEFWFNASPPDSNDSGGGDGGSADHSISDVKILDMLPGRQGRLYGAVDFKCVEFQLLFADFRHAFIAPRGGILNRGLINEYPPPLYVGYEETENDELLVIAADATFPKGQNASIDSGPGSGMWDYGSGVSDALSSQENIRNLAWNGSHGPTELGKILEYIHCVACPQSNGGTLICATGSGQIPNPPNKLPVITLDGIDRRGKTVIITSAPVPAYRTWTTSSGHAPKFNFVISDDGQKTWKLLTDVLGDGEAAIKNNWAGYTDLQAKQFAPQAYRCIQLDSTLFKSQFAKALRQVAIGDDGRQPPSVKAMIAFQQKNGTWANATTLVPVSVRTIDHQNCVLILSDRLGTLTSSPSGDPNGYFQKLDLSDATKFQVMFSSVDWIPADPKNDQSYDHVKFFVDGYIQEISSGGGDPGLKQLTEDQALAAAVATDPDAIIINAPWLVQISRDDDGSGKSTSDNRSDLTDKARLLAQQYLAGSGTPAQYIEAVGFVAGELDGLVEGIEWDQQRLITRFSINTWHVPSQAVSKQKLTEMKAQGQFPQQLQVQMMGTSMAHSEIAPPTSVPDNTPEAPPLGIPTPLLKNDVITTLSDNGVWVSASARWK